MSGVIAAVEVARGIKEKGIETVHPVEVVVFLAEEPSPFGLPDLISDTLEVVKLTSIASVVALPELLYAARQAQSITYNATPIIAAGIIYLVCLWPLVRLLSRFEHRQIALH